jgi:formiminotetrahydrofolate cyclodeaminase
MRPKEAFMSEQMMNESCRDFAAALAAKKSVPGGGAAAAYVGALGVALCSMTGNFTLGKASYAHVEADVENMLAKAECVRARLLDLVEEDAAAFAPLAAAYGIPKDDPTREMVLEKVTKAACKAPLEMMEQICAAVELLEEMLEKGSRMLVSDVGCGALLARSALEAASMNVFINTKSLADREAAEALEAECDRMLDTYTPRAERVAASVMSAIRERA